MAVLELGLLTLTVIAVSLATSTSNCPKSCTCDNKRMVCDGEFPTFIPSNAKDVELLALELDVYVDGVFCNMSWNSVRNLRLTCVMGCHHQGGLGNDTFRCLYRIESLKLEFYHLSDLNKGTFTGLDTVTSLDLTGCQRLCSPALITALSDSTMLPILSELTLKTFGTISCTTGIEIDQTFVDVIGRRPIKILDFSFSNVIFVYPNLDPICDSITLMDFSYATFGTRSHMFDSKPCKSLHVLNLNGAHLTRGGVLPFNKVNITNKSGSLDKFGPFYRNINNLYLNALVPKDFTFSFHNCSFSFTRNNVTNIELCGYRITNFDINIKITENHLRRIALANNSMENIGKHVFENLTLLREIDLSNNILSRSFLFDITFKLLFRRNSLLEVVYLSNNELTYIPFETFESNLLLSLLDLSGNKFKQITFNVTSLLHLQLLDMRNNSITAFNDNSRKALDTLYRLQRTTNMNRTLEVDLRGNVFSCDCNSFEFVQWFVNSPLFRNKDQYTCEANDRSFLMTEKAINAAKEDCERPIRRRRIIILSTLVPFITILCIIGAIVGILKQRRRLLRRKRFKDHVRLLQDNDVDFRYLIFLSFSSEDDQFVSEHVLAPLQVGS